MNDRITELLAEWRSGDRTAEERLFSAVYTEMKRLARDALRGERGDHTLQPTALVNEAYMRLSHASLQLQDRIHFLAVASRVMRRLLVDYARARGRQKRGGAYERVTLDERITPGPSGDVDLLSLEQALAKLEDVDARTAQFVQLRYLTGLSNAEIASLAGVSERTVKRDLKVGRAFLKREMAAAD